MNLHALQNLAAVVEAKELASVEKQILNAQNNKPDGALTALDVESMRFFLVFKSSGVKKSFIEISER